MNNDNFYEIYGYWHTPWWQKPIVWYGGTFLLFLLLLITFFGILYKWRSKTIINPSQNAINRLHKLTLEAVHKDASAAYTELIDILRMYVNQRFGFSVSLTEHELQEKIAHQLPLYAGEELNNVFNHATQAKFASREYMLELIHDDIENIRSFIVTTTPDGEKNS
jgi:uncharacterized membrane protein